MGAWKNAKRNADCGGPVHDISDVNKDSIGNWVRGHSSYVLASNLAIFFPCSDNLNEVELRQMAQQLRDHSALAKDLCVVPSSHNRWSYKSL